MREKASIDIGKSAREGQPGESWLADTRKALLSIKCVIGQTIGVSQARLGIFQQMDVDAEISQADIQRNLRLDRAVVTRLIKQLEAEGLLTRRPDPSDNRYNLITLTAEGHRQYGEMAAKFRKLGALLAEGISQADMQTMQRVLARVQTNAASISSSLIDERSRDVNDVGPQI